MEAGALPSVALLERAYDRGVENFDAALGSLLDGLARHPAWPRTGVIVTSDHGEALYERGYGNHGASLFDDETAVPLVARLPGVVPESGRVDCLVSLVDLMPSLCAYLGGGVPRRPPGLEPLRRPARASSPARDRGRDDATAQPRRAR